MSWSAPHVDTMQEANADQARIKRGSDPAPYANQAASADAVLMDMHRCLLWLRLCTVSQSD